MLFHQMSMGVKLKSYRGKLLRWRGMLPSWRAACCMYAEQSCVRLFHGTSRDRVLTVCCHHAEFVKMGQPLGGLADDDLCILAALGCGGAA